MKRKEFLLFIMTLGLAMLFVGCGKKESTEVVATQAVEASTEQEVSTGYQIINVSKEYPALVIKDTDLLDSEYAETSVVYFTERTV